MGTQPLPRKCHWSEANGHHVLDVADSTADYRFIPPTSSWDGDAFINTLPYYREYSPNPTYSVGLGL